VSVFGAVKEYHLDSGLHFVNPYAEIQLFSIRTRMIEYVNEVPSKEGLNIGIQVAMQYSIIPDKTPYIFKTLDKDYEQVLIEPLLSATLREVSSKRDAKAMYTSEDRVAMHMELDKKMREYLLPRGFMVEEILLRKIELPQKLKDAIENKLKMEQESERMKFVLLKEHQEAERKQIEAEGIHQFQTIVSKGIDENLLNGKASRQLSSYQIPKTRK
jgi:regulator of protease activity HflC (stomatin/prohibitin superfamily)